MTRRRVAAASVIVGCAAAFSSRSAAQVFSSKVEMVRVDALVLDGGRPVRGLTAADFAITDNGVPQQVELVSFEQIPLNVVLALDLSDSVAGERLEHLQDAGRAVLDGLTNDDQASLVTFSHAVDLRAPLTHDREAVGRALADAAARSGETSLVDGVFAGMMVGESDVGRSLLIVFTDGLDTASWLTPDAVLDAARRSDVVAYAAAIGSAGNGAFLRDLSSSTGGTLYKLESTRDLRSTFVKILEEFRHRYLVSYTPRGVAKDGWHRLDVGVKNRRVSVKARPGYLAGS